MDKKKMERLYKVLERAEKEHDTETEAALRWAVFSLENQKNKEKHEGYMGAVHEMCSECDKDYRITVLEERQHKLKELIKHMTKVSNQLCPDEELDYLEEDGELKTFNLGRGQGIFDMCMEVKEIIGPQDG